MKKLEGKELYKRLQEARNYKKLYEAQKQKNKYLREKKKLHEEQVKLLIEENKMFKKIIQTQALRIEELERIVFGRKKKKKNDNDDNYNFPNKRPCKEKKRRTKDSYRRDIPDESDVTSHQYHNINQCPKHKIPLKRKKVVIFYEEDIPLPDKNTKLKEVIKHHVEKGYCPKCRKWHSAIPIPPKKVIIGKKIKLYIIYLNILLRMTFEQIQNILWDTYRFKISDGEIGNILFELADRLRPVFERLKKKLQEGKGVHLDETSWGKGLFLWVMSSISTEDVIYLAGRTRGKGNAEELLGEDFKKIRISDAYAAYKNQPGICQQCWSHPHTKLEQLAYSKILSKKVHEHCCKAYEEFSKIYEKLRCYLKENFDPKRRAEQKKELLEEIRIFRQFNKKDPKKLQNIKQQFYDYEAEWLTCMDYEGIPCDNNKAERKLRHFVIKRKISYGNKSKEGHEAFEINASVLMTYWKTYRDDFFMELGKLCA